MPCSHSHWLRGHAIFKLCNQICSRKRKRSRNRFCLFFWDPGRIFLAKKGRKFSETVKCFYLCVRCRLWTVSCGGPLPVQGDHRELRVQPHSSNRDSSQAGYSTIETLLGFYCIPLLPFLFILIFLPFKVINCKNEKMDFKKLQNFV